MTFDLARALHATVDTPSSAPGTRGALDPELRLGYVTSRIRRRRAVRATTQASTGLATVGAVAFVGVQGIDRPDGQRPSLVPMSQVLSEACGMPADLLGPSGLLAPSTLLGVLDLTADGAVTIEYTSPEEGAGADLTVAVTEPGETGDVTLPGGLAMKLSDLGPDDRIAVARDGVVVGVMTLAGKPSAGVVSGVEFTSTWCADEGEAAPTTP